MEKGKIYLCGRNLNTDKDAIKRVEDIIDRTIDKFLEDEEKESPTDRKIENR